MKKAISLFFIVMTIAVLMVSAAFADEEPIRIGTIYAMSGGNAAIGENILRGIYSKD